MRCVEMPSTEKETLNGSAPAMEMLRLRSCWTPCESVATASGLVSLVARKLSARRLMSVPLTELSIVDRSVSITGRSGLTSTTSTAVATCRWRSMRSV
jgi:hypothetical protein